jgi:hypothetical protein
MACQSLIWLSFSSHQSSKSGVLCFVTPTKA